MGASCHTCPGPSATCAEYGVSVPLQDADSLQTRQYSEHSETELDYEQYSRKSQSRTRELMTVPSNSVARIGNITRLDSDNTRRPYPAIPGTIPLPAPQYPPPPRLPQLPHHNQQIEQSPNSIRGWVGFFLWLLCTGVLGVFGGACICVAYYIVLPIVRPTTSTTSTTSTTTSRTTTTATTTTSSTASATMTTATMTTTRGYWDQISIVDGTEITTTPQQNMTTNSADHSSGQVVGNTQSSDHVVGITTSSEHVGNTTSSEEVVGITTTRNMVRSTSGTTPKIGTTSAYWWRTTTQEWPTSVPLTLTLQNLDYASLATKPFLVLALKMRLKEGVASVLGDFTRADHMRVVLRPGSVVAEFTIFVFNETVADAVRTQLSAPTGLGHEVAVHVRSVEGISSVSTGAIHVNNIIVPAASFWNLPDLGTSVVNMAPLSTFSHGRFLLLMLVGILCLALLVSSILYWRRSWSDKGSYARAPNDTQARELSRDAPNRSPVASKEKAPTGNVATRFEGHNLENAVDRSQDAAVHMFDDNESNHSARAPIAPRGSMVTLSGLDDIEGASSQGDGDAEEKPSVEEFLGIAADMGFTESQAKQALTREKGDTTAAMDRLFSN